MEKEMNEKGMMGELIGSLAVTLLVFGDWAGTSEHGSAAAAGVAGVNHVDDLQGIRDFANNHDWPHGRG